MLTTEGSGAYDAFALIFRVLAVLLLLGALLALSAFVLAPPLQPGTAVTVRWAGGIALTCAAIACFGIAAALASFRSTFDTTARIQRNTVSLVGAAAAIFAALSSWQLTLRHPWLTRDTTFAFLVTLIVLAVVAQIFFLFSIVLMRNRKDEPATRAGAR